MNANDCIHRSDDGHLLVSSEGGHQRADQGDGEDRDLGNGELEERR